MKVFKKLKTFFSLNLTTKLLLLEAYFYLGWGCMLKRIPFSKLARSLGQVMEETSYTPNLFDKQTLLNVSNAIHIMSRYTFWESKCLVKAIAGMKMLERRGVESTLYLGTAKDEKGEFVAHAWLRSGTYYISGSEGMEKFTVVGKFAKKINHQQIEGADNG